MGLLSTLFARGTRLTRAPRRAAVEPMEARQMLAADVLFGSVYLEESLSGRDDNGDVLQVSFVGGAEGTTLERLVIDGDKNLLDTNPAAGDVFFDIVEGGAGAFEAVGLTVEPSGGFQVESVEVFDGGTSIAFNLTGFEAGDLLVFSIDVDEYGESRGELNSNAFAEGGEFEGSSLLGEFSAPGFVDLTLEGTFFDAFDPDFAAAEAAAGATLDRLPGDDYGDPGDPEVPVRTAGAVANGPQIELARLSGYVYHDRSDDGVRDAGEEAIEGVTLELLDASGVGTGVTTVTDAAGFYEFVDLQAGVWGVREFQPSGYFDGKDSVGSNGGTAGNDRLDGAVLDWGDRATDYNFGELLAASIAGRVHASTDGDCDFDDPDILLEGVVIELLDPQGQVLQTTTTDSQGRYAFAGLRPGEYQVRETQPDGYFDGDQRAGTAGGDVADDLISRIVVGSQQQATGYDFCEHVGASLSGFVYHDRSGDGLRDPGEEPIPGVEVKLLNATGSTVATATTNAAGFYRFTNLDRGVYRVMEVQPNGWLDGLDTPGNLGGVADNPGDMIRDVNLQYGDDAQHYNFGELLPGSIAGRVHASNDHNCDFDDPDMLLEGVTIQLLDAQGNLLQTTQTNALGEYRFDELAPGEYQIREIQPDGFFDGSERAGTAGGVASDDLVSGILLGSSFAATNYDFCEHVGASLSGYVYHDRSDDGVRDAGEEAIEGVTLELLDASGVGTGVTTVTDAAGFYEFVDLQAGVWGVREFQPSGYFDGKDSVGSNGGTAGNDRLDGAVLDWGDRATDYNFGELLAASIAGRVHASTDGDCDFDDPDILLEGVVIELLDPQGQVLQTTTTDSQGRYAFAGLRPGEYQVRETQPDGYFDGDQRAGTAGGDVADDLISRIVVGSQQQATGYDFCEHVGASLSGFVYHDRSGDGLRDPGEEPIPGVEVKLLNATGSTVATATTNAAGFYRFTNLDRGVYRVMEVQPNGWLDGLDTPGNLGGVADNPGDMIRDVNLQYGDDAQHYNFGELLPGSIAGRVHASNDHNCDDIDLASPIAGVVVELLDANGDVIRSTTTDTDGRYRFDGLPPGEYAIRETQPADYFDGGERLGTAGGTVFDDLFTGVVIGSDENATGYHFCETPPASLSGFVFIDGLPVLTIDGELPDNLFEIRDGLRSADDTPLAGVTLRLVNGATGMPFYQLKPGETEDDAPDGFAAIETIPGTYPDGVFETVTDANGHYQFLNLPSGSYAVVQVGVDGLIDWIDTPGSTGGTAINPGIPSDPGLIPIVPFRNLYGADVIYGVTLEVGDRSVENNFSEIDTTQPFFLPPEVTETPAPFVPPIAITPGRPLLFPPLTLPEEETFLGFDGSGDVVGWTWHLSVINAGQPRTATEAGPPVRFAADTSDDVWRDVDRDAAEMRRAKWRLLASDIQGAELNESFFGNEEAIPVAGDWDGDGVAEIGVFFAGEWLLDLDGDGRWSKGDLWARLGSRDDLPVTGDWDGDGKTDIGVFGPAWPRDPHAIQHEPGMPDAANWPGRIADKAKNVPPSDDEATSGHRLLSQRTIETRRADVIDHVFHYGVPGDAPIAGDFNGDGIRTIGVFYDGQWTLDSNGDGRLDDGDAQVTLGRPGDTPIVGDWDGDGRDDLGVRRGGVWMADTDRDGALEELRFAAADEALADESATPVVGDWDGDGRDEPAVYRNAGENAAPESDVRVAERKAG